MSSPPSLSNSTTPSLPSGSGNSDCPFLAQTSLPYERPSIHPVGSSSTRILLLSFSEREAPISIVKMISCRLDFSGSDPNPKRAFPTLTCLKFPPFSILRNQNFTPPRVMKGFFFPVIEEASPSSPLTLAELKGFLEGHALFLTRRGKVPPLF